MAFVLDASMAMAWCFDDERTDVSEAVLLALSDDEAIVPAVWSSEVTNATLRGLRRNRLTPTQVLSFLRTLDQLVIIYSDPLRAGMIPHLLKVARDHELSAYDAAYLELAERLGLPLATLDVRLRAAAAQAGVPLFWTSGLRGTK
ncbi:MAG: type II toxin-antitoxin system VapC family toxin [Chloroflexota bacterium]|nr:type II toxin-antitoxin system VapC family toxin [Chloroflexota bacterium]